MTGEVKTFAKYNRRRKKPNLLLTEVSVLGSSIVSNSFNLFLIAFPSEPLPKSGLSFVVMKNPEL